MRAFGELQAAVMNVIWDGARPMTVREVLTELNEGTGRSLAYTTVMTVLVTLHSKGHLNRQMVDGAWQYTAVRTREDHGADLMADVLGASGNRHATLLAFVDQLSPAEAKKLATAIQHAKRPRGGQRS